MTALMGVAIAGLQLQCGHFLAFCQKPGEMDVPSVMEDIDRFFKETSRSFDNVKLKNQREKTLFNRETNGLNHQAKVSRWKMEREQRTIIAQLQRFKAERSVFAITDLKDPEPVSDQELSEEEDHFVNPFPITFKSTSKDDADTEFEKMGKRFAARRGRRQSKEFEDLGVHTATGQLLPPDFKSRNKASKSFLPPLRLGSNTNLGTMRQTHWLGEPECINSVRRPRKTIDQQETDLEILRTYSKVDTAKMMSRGRSSAPDLKQTPDRSALSSRASSRTSVPNIPLTSPRSRPTSALSVKSAIETSMFTRRKSPSHVLNIELASSAQKQRAKDDNWTKSPTLLSPLHYLTSPRMPRKLSRSRKVSASSTISEVSPRTPPESISPRGEKKIFLPNEEVISANNTMLIGVDFNDSSKKESVSGKQNRQRKISTPPSSLESSPRDETKTPQHEAIINIVASENMAISGDTELNGN